MTTYSARPTRRFNLRWPGSTEESDRLLKITRFAPSTTGPAHLGTLFAALIAWLFARHHQGRAILRLENLDPQRCKEDFLKEMLSVLKTCGLNFDEVQRQDERIDYYRSILEDLRREGRIYVCNCSRKRIKSLGRTTPEGGFAYDNHCRTNAWKGGAHDGALRLRLDADAIQFVDHCNHPQQAVVSELFGDPIIKRRDGAFAYHFAATLDDDRSGVSDVVRGRDLVWSTPPQMAVRQVLNLPVPRYHHHPLLLESHAQKLAKLHGSLPISAILQERTPADLIGYLAWLANLIDEPLPMTPTQLINGFDWDTLPKHDWLVHWAAPELTRTAVAWSVGPTTP